MTQRQILAAHNYASLGPVRCVAVDQDGRRFPCACHVEPCSWVLALATPTPDGKIAYAVIPILQTVTRPRVCDFENAFNTLLDLLEHPEFYP